MPERPGIPRAIKLQFLAPNWLTSRLSTASSSGDQGPFTFPPPPPPPPPIPSEATNSGSPDSAPHSAAGEWSSTFSLIVFVAVLGLVLVSFVCLVCFSFCSLSQSHTHTHTKTESLSLVSTCLLLNPIKK